jgi:hypothetical protein
MKAHNLHQGEGMSHSNPINGPDMFVTLLTSNLLDPPVYFNRQPTINPVHSLARRRRRAALACHAHLVVRWEVRRGRVVVALLQQLLHSE